MMLRCRGIPQDDLCGAWREACSVAAACLPAVAVCRARCHGRRVFRRSGHPAKRPIIRPKSHLLRPRWDFGRMISDNKRIECCCHVAYAARTVAGMLDHITLHVPDVGRSIAFYEHALAPLGYIVKAHHEPTLGFGVDDGTPHSDFYVSALDDAALAPPPTHIAFLAPNREAVRGFHAAALAVGGRDNGAPGPRPYHPGYYSAFVLDPDGNNIEAVVDWAGWFENHR